MAPSGIRFIVESATTKKLFSVGIKTIGELAAADQAWLKSILKKQREVIYGKYSGRSGGHLYQLLGKGKKRM